MVLGVQSKYYLTYMLHMEYFLHLFPEHENPSQPLCFELVAEPVVWQPATPRASHMLYLDYLPMNFLHSQSFDLTYIAFTLWWLPSQAQ